MSSWFTCSSRYGLLLFKSFQFYILGDVLAQNPIAQHVSFGPEEPLRSTSYEKVFRLGLPHEKLHSNTELYGEFKFTHLILPLSIDSRPLALWAERQLLLHAYKWQPHKQLRIGQHAAVSQDPPLVLSIHRLAAYRI